MGNVITRGIAKSVDLVTREVVLIVEEPHAISIYDCGKRVLLCHPDHDLADTSSVQAPVDRAQVALAEAARLIETAARAITEHAVDAPEVVRSRTMNGTWTNSALPRDLQTCTEFAVLIGQRGEEIARWAANMADQRGGCAR